MWYINKLDEPEEIVEWKRKFKKRFHRKPGYDDLDKESVLKDTLRTNLIKEQNGLCGYCCSSLIDNAVHIEHIRPRGKMEYAELSLDYNNLLASCIPKSKYDHCGHYKDNNFDEGLFISPYEKDCEDYFEYSEITGSVSGKDGNLKAEYMIKLLNLNENRLKRSRLEAIWTSEIMCMTTEELQDYKVRLETGRDIVFADAQLYVVKKLLNQ